MRNLLGISAAVALIAGFAAAKYGGAKSDRSGDENGETIFEACARVLTRMIAVARSREDATSFAAVFKVALGVPGWFSLAELSDRVDVSESALLGWCDPRLAPQPVMREVVLDELEAMLAETTGVRDDNLELSDDDTDLACNATLQLTEIVRARLAHGGGIDRGGWLSQLTPVIGFVRPDALRAVAAKLGYTDADARSWSNGASVPRGSQAEAFITALADIFDVSAQCDTRVKA